MSVEAGGRLVGDEERGAAGEGSRVITRADAAGELVRVASTLVSGGDAHQAQELSARGRRLGGGGLSGGARWLDDCAPTV